MRNEEEAGRERTERVARSNDEPEDPGVDAPRQRDDRAPREQDEGGAEQRFSQAGIMLQFRLSCRFASAKAPADRL